MQIILVLLALLLAFASTAAGKTINVPGDSATIQSGINGALTGDTVLVATGSYTGDGNWDLDFGGKAIVLKSSSGPETTTILCADNSSEGWYHRGLIFQNAEDTSAVLDGFTLTQPDNADSRADGGGIQCNGSSPKIINCRFVGIGRSGAFYCTSASPIIRDCEFSYNISGNSAELQLRESGRLLPYLNGAALSCANGSSPTVSNCEFRSNFGDEKSGGAVACNNASPTFTDCRFESNGAYFDGGAVMCSSGSNVTFRNCQFRKNYVYYGNGGAISLLNSNAVFESCVVDSNHTWNSSYYGGGIYISDCPDVELARCTLTRNTTSDYLEEMSNDGAAIYAGGSSSVSMEYCIVAFNGALAYALCCGGNSSISLSCSDMFGNMAGDWNACANDQLGENNNLSVNPVFCDLRASDLHLAVESPLAPANNVCGEQIGALGTNCSVDLTPPSITAIWPPVNAIDVPPEAEVSVTFDRDMIPSSTGLIVRSSNQVPTGSSSYSAATRTVTFSHNYSPFRAGDVISVNLNPNAASDEWVPVDTAFSWSFTVGTENPYGSVLQFSSGVALSASPTALRIAELNHGWGPNVLAVTQYDDSLEVLSIDTTGSITRDTLYFLDGRPEDLVTSDFDRDGDLDVAVTLDELARVALLYNDGMGRFDSSRSFAVAGFPVGTTIARISEADVNLDGWPDLVTISSFGISALVSDRSGGFHAYVASTADIYPSYLCTGDFDCDGLVDVALSSGWNGHLQIMHGKGDGTFSADTVLTEILAIYCLAPADMNGDGYLDILCVTGSYQDSLTTLLNDGNGGLALASAIALGSHPAGATPMYLSTADFDGDADIDVAASRSGGIQIIFNDGSGNLFARTDYAGSVSCSQVCTFDVEGDGDVDVVGSNYSSVGVFVNRPSFTGISISPRDTSISSHDNAAFTVTGNWGYDSSRVLTDLVRWRTQSNGVAYVGSTGLVAAAHPGNSTLFAKVDLFEDSTMVTVLPALNLETNDSLVEVHQACSLYVEVLDTPDSVVALCRSGGADNFTRLHMSENGPSLYTARVPDSFVGIRGFEYAFLAYENDQTGSTPKSDYTMHPYRTRVSLVNESSAPLPDGLFHMIGFPFDVSPDDFDSVMVDDLGEPSASTWKLGKWYGSGYLKNRAIDRISRSEGYWYYSESVGSIDASGLSAVPDTFVVSTGSWYCRLSLAPGWNQISTPCAFPISWTGRIETVPNSLDPTTYAYSSGLQDPLYTTVSTLNPYVGYWVYNRTSSSKSLLLPYTEILLSRQQESPRLSLPNEHEYMLTLTLKAAGLSSNGLVLGVSPEASDDWDGLDYCAPPGIGDYLTVASTLVDAESKEHYLGSDWRATGRDGQTYDLRAYGSSAVPVTLDCRKSETFPEHYIVVIIDPESGFIRLIESGETFQLPVVPSETSALLRLLVGTPSYVEGHSADLLTVPDKYSLSQNYPNPFNASTTITFELPKTARVTIKVYNVLGQLVRVLADDNYPAGVHRILWDGTNSDGDLVASGVFFYRLTAGDFTDTKKMVGLK